MLTFLDTPEVRGDVPHGSYWDVTVKEDSAIIKIVDVDYDAWCHRTQFAAAGRGISKDSPASITFYGYIKTTPR